MRQNLVTLFSFRTSRFERRSGLMRFAADFVPSAGLDTEEVAVVCVPEEG